MHKPDEPEALNPADIHAGFYTIYVYTDIIELVIVFYVYSHAYM